MARYDKYTEDEDFVGPELPFRNSLIGAGYDPQNATKFGRVAGNLDAKGYDTYIGRKAGIRTAEDTAKNKANNVSDTSHSQHESGAAIDLRDRKLSWNAPNVEERAYAQALGQAAKDEGMGWGGDWFFKKKKFNQWDDGIGWDPHHIQVKPTKVNVEALIRLRDRIDALPKKNAKAESVLRRIDEALGPHVKSLRNQMDEATTSNQDLPWVSRALSGNKENLRNQDGSVSTHLLAAEVDKDGRWMVFPTVVKTKDGLVRMPLRDAQKHAVENNTFMDFGDNKDLAIQYSQNGLIDHNNGGAVPMSNKRQKTQPAPRVQTQNQPIEAPISDRQQRIKARSNDILEASRQSVLNVAQKLRGNTQTVREMHRRGIK